jgi:hypothetical protein
MNDNYLSLSLDDEGSLDIGKTVTVIGTVKIFGLFDAPETWQRRTISTMASAIRSRG